MTGVKNFLNLVYENWTVIWVVIGIAFIAFDKFKKYTKEESDVRVANVKRQIKEVILKMVTEAELDFADWNKSGSIKRATVIGQIFAEYPILSTVVDQEALINWIDCQIEESLIKLKKIIDGE